MGVANKIVAWLEVKNPEVARAGNDANKPVPGELCTWGILDYFAVLPWSAFSIATWSGGATILSLGLTVGQAMAAVAVAYVLKAVFCIAAGQIGVDWRISGSLTNRLAWGVRGYAFVVGCQIAMTTVHYGIQSVFGYLSLKVVIGAVIPSFTTMHNSFSSSLPTNDFICLIIFLAICIVGQAYPPDAWRTIGKVAAVFTVVTFVTIVSLCCSEAGGVGPLWKEPYSYVGISEKPSSSQVIWSAFLTVSIMSAHGNIMYQPNYTRFAKSRMSPIPAQLVTTLVFELCVTLFGILAASAAVSVFPEEKKLLWTPLEILLAYQKRGGATVRAATFFGGLALTIPQFGINVVWNAYTTGVGYATLFPRWFTIRRGGYLTTALAIAFNPWLFAGKPNSYARVLNGMSMLTGSLTGIFLADYFIARKRFVKVDDLLIAGPASTYFYAHGWNWRAGVAFLLVIWLPFPGWISVIKDNANLLGGPWQMIYGLCWMLCFLIAGITHCILSKIWPSKPASAGIATVGENDVESAPGKGEPSDLASNGSK
ncbi:hypothetical protein P389DRAFT_208145 [Cystobasidium minutum MCA 4210]|uniref:uncharacterized protein n=1 Tax=Cystobasidium minutum MCA 4210 TaxID=1397322 RepID=UPI0034CF51F6|eukprot:jgi/Rhomi1/208145/estExt_Genemark1.C_1_t30165